MSKTDYEGTTEETNNETTPLNGEKISTKNASSKTPYSTSSYSTPQSSSSPSRHRCRVDSSSIFGYIWFAFTYPTFKQGYLNNGISPEDIDDCSRNDTAEVVSKRLKRLWNENVRKYKQNVSLTKTLFCAFSPYFIVPLLISIFEECIIRVAQPLFLGIIIRYFAGSELVTREWALYSGAGVCLCTIVFITTHHPLMMHLSRLGMRMRVASCSLMYEKALKLSRSSLNQTAVGQIVNIMSNDMNRFDEFALASCYLVCAPIQMCIIIYIVWQMLGVTSLAGLLFLGLLIPFQGFMGKLFSIVRSRTACLTDKRLKFMNEIISGIRVIKMYNWEKPFAERIADARKNEVCQIRNSLFLKSINICMFFIASRLILFSCLFVYALLDNVLTAEKVFVAMALFNTLRLTMTLMFSNAITAFAELKISIKRIRNFLLLDEIDESGINHSGKVNLGPEASLDIVEMSASYNPEHPYPTLQNISVSLKPGELLAVIGKVGSSKTALIMSLLGELPLSSGSIDVKGTLSYASQEAWSLNDSIRQNIIFGKEYDPKLYRKVIDVCALERDLELMPLGDRTLVGEKGYQLSGGQKARLNLARAVYRQSDIFLFDDPLSAVDAGVAEHILNKCILDHLKDKIRVLVTHQIQFVEKADKILVLQDGRCLAFGTYQELEKMGIDFMSLLEADPSEKETKNDDDDDDDYDGKRYRKESEISLEMSKFVENNALSTPRKSTRTQSEGDHTGLSKQVLYEGDEEKSGENDDDENINETSPVIKVQDEKRFSGSISGRVYLDYFRAGATCFSVMTMIVFSIISQLSYHGIDIFLAYWTNKNQYVEKKLQNLTYPFDDDDSDDLVPQTPKYPDALSQRTDSLIYASIIVILFITTLIRSASFFTICIRASQNLHDQIFARILRAPVRFFDQNPVGRILNRFAKDLGIVDEMLPYVAFDLNLILSQALGVIVTVCLVNWYLFFPALFLVLAIIFIRSIYILSARDIKRVEALARSPLYSHVDLTINGLSSIRAYGAQSEFENQFRVYQNIHSASWFSFISTSRCMGLAMDWVSAIFIIIITVSVMFGHPQPGGNVGLLISTGLMLAGMTQWGIRQSCEFESQMTSVERIVEYKDLDQEAPAKSCLVVPSVKWPEKGTIEFQQMSLSYDEPGTANNAVLKDITCVINGGEKIGIVGRTGAGKSSTIGVLFRLTEPAGKVLIDDIDIQKIGLDDLRKKISIIPQDPVIFSGTIRYNLDPFEEYSDADIWSALEKVQLKETVMNYVAKLDQPLSEGGANLSVGQKQLICLARAILRNNQILILDEATANVDYHTDNLIQTQLRTQFAKCTVLTIAHRFNSIIDADRVLVLDAGRIVEFDQPYLLLKSKGFFYRLCKRTGESMFNHLYRSAKHAYKRRTHVAKSGTDQTSRLIVNVAPTSASSSQSSNSLSATDQSSNSTSGSSSPASSD